MFITVGEFHAAFGHPIAPGPELPEQSLRDLRIKLIEEELFEYCDAYDADDHVEMADALGDMLYVLAGAALCYGIADRDNPVWSPYETMTPVAKGSTNFPELLREDFAAYLAAEEADDLNAIQQAICHMMVEIFGIARQSGIPINAVFREIHRSNMSKLGADGRPIYRADGKILKGENYSPPNLAPILANHKHD